jgi:hypothetical protein
VTGETAKEWCGITRESNKEVREKAERERAANIVAFPGRVAV